MELMERDKTRYNRQMMIPGWGERGQEKIKNSKIFVAGAGGLGSPVSIYLAVGGVGNIKIIDKDVPELSNLNRQILHTEEDIGRPKAQSAKEKLIKINRDIKIEGIKETITEENVLSLVGDSDVILDCMDNFPTRYVLNKIAIEKRIPLVHASIWGLEGRATFILPGETPCLECIFPEGPPKEEVFPVLGTTAAIMGCIQATETLKYIAGIGKLLKNRLLIYDGEDMIFSEVKIRRDPECPSCSEL